MIQRGLFPLCLVLRSTSADTQRGVTVKVICSHRVFFFYLLWLHLPFPVIYPTAHFSPWVSPPLLFHPSSWIYYSLSESQSGVRPPVVG